MIMTIFKRLHCQNNHIGIKAFREFLITILFCINKNLNILLFLKKFYIFINNYLISINFKNIGHWDIFFFINKKIYYKGIIKDI